MDAMKMDKTQLAFGAAMLGAFGAFWRWHSPQAAPLTNGEIDRYLEIIGGLPLPDGEAETIAGRLRGWADADDGKPVYMVNLMRFHPELRRWPGAPEFDGTPQEANVYYERSLAPLWLRNAAYPILGGAVQGVNLMETAQDQERWDEARVVRYPNRRTFLRLLSDPSYRRVAPYKAMATESDLVAISGDVRLPEPRLIVGGGLLTLFIGTGWLRARLVRSSPARGGC